MESLQTLTTVVTIVSVIFGILNLVLFFKIWGMTDNVKRMLNIMERNNIESIDDNTANRGGENHDIGGKILIGLAIIFIIGIIIFAAAN